MKILRLVYRTVMFPYRFVKRKINDRQVTAFATQRLQDQTITAETFDFDMFRSSVLTFVNSLQAGDSGVRFLYSATSTAPTLYASAYSCLTYSLLGELEKFSADRKKRWASYFDSFQHEADGLFYDPTVRNQHFDDSDWWGARHLALHMINAYTALGEKPKYPFRYLEKYYDLKFLDSWLSQNENKFFSQAPENDFDNKLMNIGCLLQYQRDFFNDSQAGESVKFIQNHLLARINPNTGLWGDDDITDPSVLSRKVQFAYHLLPLFFYDGIFSFDLSKLEKAVLATKNKFGGFGVAANSSACEDIDSIEILTRIGLFTDSDEIRGVLKNGFRWVLANQMPDGGFVFRLHEDFTYGHEQMHAGKNTGAIFPTWFRTLSLAYLAKYLKISHKFKMVKCPGYEY